MAKNVGLIGSVSGKIGNVVYAVQNGIQTARVYQPIVSNPKSSLQQMQRAKGNLVGQLSAIVPKGVIVGLGTNNRSRRSKFLSLALKAATAGYVAGSTTDIQAKLLPGAIVFSQGPVVPAHTTSGTTAVEGSVSVVVSPIASLSPEVLASTGLMVAAVITNDAGKYNEVVYRVLAPKDITSALTVTMPVSMVAATSAESTASYHAHFFRIPFSTDDGTSLTSVAERLLGDATQLSALLTNNPSALPLRWGNSLYVTTASYTAS